MICRNLVGAIEVYQVGSRVLYAKTGERNFALFEDELTPEELVAIAGDITRRGTGILGGKDQAQTPGARYTEL